MKYVAIIAVLPLLLGAPVQAADSSSGEQAKTSSDQSANNGDQSKKPKGEKLICSRQIVTGSMFPHRVCKTQSQIDAENAAGNATLDSLQEQGRIGGSRPG